MPRLATALVLLVVAATVARADDGLAGDGNVVRGAVVRTSGARGGTEHLEGGRLASDGSPWDAPGAVILEGFEGEIVVELPSAVRVRALLLQADNNDGYLVEGATDGADWALLWGVPSRTEGRGLWTRRHVLDEARDVRRFRIRASGGDGAFSVAGFQAFARLPQGWSGRADGQTSLFAALDQRWVDAIKSALAVLGLLVLVWCLLRPTEESRRATRVRRGALAMVGLLSLVAWWNLGKFHFPHYTHTWDTLHYYLGAKYVRELGHTNLYECVVVADLESGRADSLVGATVRNLHTNTIESVEPILADPSRCTRAFADDRWAEFKHDVGWFRDRMAPDRWQDMRRDHGYNGTPVWGLLGTTLARLAPASDVQVYGLVALDPLLLLAMWGAVVWAFGWETACAALIFWGTSYLSRFWWTGGSYLRHDWFVHTVLGICLMKKERPAAAGAVLAYATLLRIFPGYVVLGVILKALVHAIRARRLVLLPAHKRFFVGGILATGVLVALSSAVAGRSGIWLEFIENSRKHISTPLTNNMGLKTLMGYEHSQRARFNNDPRMPDPFVPWKHFVHENQERRLPLFVVLVLGAVVLVAWAVRDTEDWIALVLGVGLIPVTSELTCYYYMFLAVYGLLWRRHPFVPVALAGLSWVSTIIPPLFDWYDELFALESVAVLAFVLAVTVWVGRRPRPREAVLESSPPADTPPPPAPRRRERRRRA